MICLRVKSPGRAGVGLRGFLNFSFDHCSSWSDERWLVNEDVKKNIWLSPDSISLLEGKLAGEEDELQELIYA